LIPEVGMDELLETPLNEPEDVKAFIDTTRSESLARKNPN